MPRNTEDDWWRLEAACRGVAFQDDSFDTYFPEYEKQRGQVNVRVSEKATQLCSKCPVTAQCLDFAMRNYIEDGTWGGKSPAERERMRRRWNKDKDLLNDLEFESVL